MTAKILEGCLCILNSDYRVAVYKKKLSLSRQLFYSSDYFIV